MPVQTRRQTREAAANANADTVVPGTATTHHQSQNVPAIPVSLGQTRGFRRRKQNEPTLPIEERDDVRSSRATSQGAQSIPYTRSIKGRNKMFPASEIESAAVSTQSSAANAKEPDLEKPSKRRGRQRPIEQEVKRQTPEHYRYRSGVSAAPSVSSNSSEHNGTQTPAHRHQPAAEGDVAARSLSRKRKVNQSLGSTQEAETQLPSHRDAIMLSPRSKRRRLASYLTSQERPKNQKKRMRDNVDDEHEDQYTGQSTVPLKRSKVDAPFPMASSPDLNLKEEEDSGWISNTEKDKAGEPIRGDRLSESGRSRISASGSPVLVGPLGLALQVADSPENVVRRRLAPNLTRSTVQSTVARGVDKATQTVEGADDLTPAKPSPESLAEVQISSDPIMEDDLLLSPLTHPARAPIHNTNDMFQSEVSHIRRTEVNTEWLELEAKTWFRTQVASICDQIEKAYLELKGVHADKSSIRQFPAWAHDPKQNLFLSTDHVPVHFKPVKSQLCSLFKDLLADQGFSQVQVSWDWSTWISIRINFAGPAQQVDGIERVFLRYSKGSVRLRWEIDDDVTQWQ